MSIFSNIFSTKKYLVSFVAFIFLTSCSSIFNGSLQDVRVNSTPENAKIYVNGNFISNSPSTVKLKRGETHVIELRKDGYQTFKITTSKNITGWFWGNLICGGVLGFIIDLASGNAYDVEPGAINAILDKGIGMNEKYQLENFSIINVNDENGHNLGSLKITWE